MNYDWAISELDISKQTRASVKRVFTVPSLGYRLRKYTKLMATNQVYTFKIGDIVTGYYSGYYKITAIEDRSHEKYTPSPLLTGVWIDPVTKKERKKVRSWDAGYSKPAAIASKEIAERAKEAYEKATEDMNALNKMID